MKTDKHFYGSVQEQKILTERTDTSNGFSFGVCGKGVAIHGTDEYVMDESGSGMSFLSKMETLNALSQNDDDTIVMEV